MCDMVIFRENTEDVYSGIEEEGGTEKAARLIKFINEDLGYRDKMGGILETSGVGIKPISPQGTKNIVRLAIKYALANGRKKVTFMHKGNIMKFTEGAFKLWGYELAKEEFRDQVILEDEYWILYEYKKNPDADLSTLMDVLYKEGMVELTPDYVKHVCDTLAASHGPRMDDLLMVNDRIADSMFQQIQLRPREYEVIACPNLNGDYISDALAAMIGGLGIAPGANIGEPHAMFEATHGTAPKYTAMDKANPGSVMLSGALMLDHLGWKEAGDLVRDGIAATIRESADRAQEGPGKEMFLTYDLVRQFPGYSAKEGAKASKFTDRIIHHIQHTL
jgi:isocitrate dehydrogenase